MGAAATSKAPNARWVHFILFLLLTDWMQPRKETQVATRENAQAPGRGRQAGPPYRPAAGAKDLRAVLFNWTWYLGMLRGLDEHELVATLEYQGKAVWLGQISRDIGVRWTLKTWTSRIS